MQEHTRQQIDSLKSTLDVTFSMVRDSKQLIGECRDDYDALHMEINKLSRENQIFKERLGLNEKRVRANENYSRKLNLIIEGVTKDKNESQKTLHGQIQHVLRTLGCNVPE